MNRMIAGLIAAALLLSQSVRADQIPGSGKTVAGWSVGAYDDGKGRFSHCAMSTLYRSGITMFYSVSGNYSWRVGWSHPSWRFEKGQKVTLAVFVDGSGPFTLEAVARDKDLAFAELPAKAALFDLMRKGYKMTVEAEGRSYGFNLDGTYAALTEILECTGRYTGVASAPPPPTPSTPSLMTQSNRPASKSDAGVTAEQKLEATKVVANILAQGDMSNFRLLTSKEIAELDSDYMTKSHVVWRAEGLVGTLRILPNKKITLGEVNAAIIGDDARACKGKFASGSVADDKSRSVLRLFTACEEDGKAFEYRYTVVPVGDGTHYLFSTIGLADGGERAGRVAKVESALRQAVYEVMKQ